MIPASEALEISKELREFPDYVDDYLERSIRKTAELGNTSFYFQLSPLRYGRCTNTDDDDTKAKMWIAGHLEFARNELHKLGYSTDLGSEYTLWVSWNEI